MRHAYGDINAAIDEIGNLVRKYKLLLKTASLPDDLVPIIPDEWKAPFRQPWLVERSGRLGAR